MSTGFVGIHNQAKFAARFTINLLAQFVWLHCVPKKVQKRFIVHTFIKMLTDFLNSNRIFKNVHVCTRIKCAEND